MKKDEACLLVAFFAFAPITIPALLASIAYESAKRRRRHRRGAGNPPRRAPGQRIGDRVDQLIRLPQQRRKYRRLQKKTTYIDQTSRLSYELCSIIIILLRDDPSALRNCSLVCRAWVFPARAQLFTTLKPIGHAAYDFVTLIRSPYCTIPRHLRWVDLQDTTYWTTVEALLREMVSANFTIQALNLVLWSPFRHDSRFSSLNVTILDVAFSHQSLEGNKSRPGKPFNAIFASFPNLQSLSIRLPPFYAFPPDATLPPPQTLKHLSIHAPLISPAHTTLNLADHVFEWFLRPAYKLQLESMGYFTDCSIPPSTYLAGFLKTPRGQALKSLEVLASNRNNDLTIPLDVYFPLNDTPLPNLTTLQLRITPFLSSEQLLSVLQRILHRFPNLQCLALRYSDADRRNNLVSIPSYAQVQTVFPFCEEHVESGNGLDALGKALKGNMLRMYTRPV